jgi:hypothetical protein
MKEHHRKRCNQAQQVKRRQACRFGLAHTLHRTLLLRHSSH